MKKLCYLFVSILMILSVMSVTVNAANEFEFELNYTGDVVLNDTKEATVILRGINATTYTNARVNVEVEGPATPSIIATDSLNQQIDIAQNGYWGPKEGFAVSGTFENETPVKVTFTAAGTYTIKLTLVDMQNSEAEIISKSFTIEVLEDKISNEIIEDNEVIGNEDSQGNNTIDKLPQTGTSTIEYIIWITLMIAIVGFIYYRINIKNN